MLELNNSNSNLSTKKIAELSTSKDAYFELKLPEDFCRKSFNRNFCEHVKIDLTKEKRQLPKLQSMEEILPCQHLKCIMRRLVVIFQSLKFSPLIMASKNKHLLGITESPDWKSDPSTFIISRLIKSGSDLNATTSEGIILFFKIIFR